MIYVTGDTHGPKAYSVYGVDGVSRRFNRNSFPEQKEMTRDDYMIICGDFGCIWNYDSRYDPSRSAFKDVICLDHGESKEEKYWLDWLEGKSFTTVFCDGLRHIQKNLKEYKVTSFFCVPLILEAMHKKVVQTIKKQKKETAVKFAKAISKFLLFFKIDNYE